MIQRLVAFALRTPFVILALAVFVIASGGWAYKQLDIEAYPNPVPPLVEVIAQPQGSSAEEVERYVTVPLEIGLAGMPGLEHIRSSSLFGLADVKCYFKWGVTYKDARQEVINRLQFIKLPEGVQVTISPWNAIGEVYRYTVRGPGYSSRELKTAQDWILERQFKRVDGVADVVSFGGETKEFHVAVDPFQLRAHDVPLDRLLAAIANGNQNVGGQRLFLGEQSYDVRGIGLLKNPQDIGNIVLGQSKGTPVLVRQVAEVSEGAAPRLGMVGRDDDADVVQGTVLMRYGGETPTTLKGIYARVDDIGKTHVLPPGMSIEKYYDRGDLVKVTTGTVIHNVVEGMLLVTLVLWLFLGHTRAAIVTAVNIPIALLVAFIGMVTTGTPANLISLGAVDFGIVVDSTVIMMENIFAHVGGHGEGTMRQRIETAAREVSGPMLFSTIIIGVAFLPLFTMTGVSGVIFTPIAYTYAFAIGGAVLMSLTLTPVLADEAIPADTEEKENAFVRGLRRVYHPLFRLSVKRPLIPATVGLVPIVLCVALFPMLGREFMPKLEEGNFWIRATFPTSISLDQSARYVGKMRRILRGCPDDDTVACTDQNRKWPEVITVVSQLGRPDDGTDASGFYNVEFFAPLMPFDKWPHQGLTKEKLTDELSRELNAAFPGVGFNFSQMISDNVEEAMSGVKGENSVKVIGPDLVANEKNAAGIVQTLQSIPGIRDLGTFRSLEQPSIRIVADRAAAARYGLNSGDVAAVVQAAIGGKAVTQVYEKDRSFDLVVRWKQPFRDSIEAIREISVSTPDGASVPLGQLAQIGQEIGPAVIYREDGQRFSPVKFSVRGRDLASTIAEARARVATSKEVKLSWDTHLEWGGQINEMNEAEARLRVVIPVTLALIAFFVYAAVRSWVDSLIVLSSIPIACTGGVLALLITRIHFSVSAAMGFISIFGIAIQDAILVVTYFQRLRASGALTLEEAAEHAAIRQFRAGLMATLVATLGLLPAALSHGIGSETQKPLAVVVIGGTLILAILTRVLQPAVLVIAHRVFRTGHGGPPPGAPPQDTEALLD